MSGRYGIGQISVQEVNSARRHAEARTYGKNSRMEELLAADSNSPRGFHDTDPATNARGYCRSGFSLVCSGSRSVVSEHRWQSPVQIATARNGVPPRPMRRKPNQGREAPSTRAGSSCSRRHQHWWRAYVFRLRCRLPAMYFREGYLPGLFAFIGRQSAKLPQTALMTRQLPDGVIRARTVDAQAFMRQSNTSGGT